LKLVECVPNFSEGRDSKIIDAIGKSVKKVPGVKLLGIDPDKDYHRTVVTFAGEPEAVLEGAFQATQTATASIDMRLHHGEHPRIGATDVVPFVPISGVSMQECVDLAKRFGARVAEQLRLPVYLYEEAASRAERKNLSDIRKGEYEGLSEKLKQKEWEPDFGSTEFNPKSGALVTGARFFLIAYNVNLTTDKVDVANEISGRIRESGRVLKDDSGKTILDEKGKPKREKGTLRAIKAMGVLLDAHKIVQVSINVLNFNITPPHVAFEEVKNWAHQFGVKVTGSEIVGLTPKEALLIAGKFYEVRKGKKALSEKKLIDLAIQEMGLSQLAPFEPEDKIIEYKLGKQ
jgi:glutamate formiminotransferase/formiminotetrahydrofolate cyclodeaminase